MVIDTSMRVRMPATSCSTLNDNHDPGKQGGYAGCEGHCRGEPRYLV